jgi:hypothetical protein
LTRLGAVGTGSAPTMKIARVESRCECQAQLVAELDEARSVVRGFVSDRARGRELQAPANATKKIGDKQVDVGWSCPMCTRNTLRTFNIETLAYH